MKDTKSQQAFHPHQQTRAQPLGRVEGIILLYANSASCCKQRAHTQGPGSLRRKAFPQTMFSQPIFTVLKSKQRPNGYPWERSFFKSMFWEISRDQKEEVRWKRKNSQWAAKSHTSIPCLLILHGYKGTFQKKKSTEVTQTTTEGLSPTNHLLGQVQAGTRTGLSRSGPAHVGSTQAGCLKVPDPQGAQGCPEAVSPAPSCQLDFYMARLKWVEITKMHRRNVPFFFLWTWVHFGYKPSFYLADTGDKRKTQNQAELSTCIIGVLGKKESEVIQSCQTLCDPVDCSLPCSSIHGIFQAGVLEWGAVSFSTGSSRPRDWIQVSHIVGRRFTVCSTREV